MDQIHMCLLLSIKFQDFPPFNTQQMLPGESIPSLRRTSPIREVASLQVDKVVPLAKGVGGAHALGTSVAKSQS